MLKNILNKNTYSYNEQRQALAEVLYDEIFAFSKNYLNELFLEALAFGNVI